MSAFAKLRRLHACTCRRLASESGETLTETLVSILVGTLALIMLANAIMTAKNIVTLSKQKMDEHYTAENDVVDGVDAKRVDADADFTVELTESGAGKVATLAEKITVYSEDPEGENATSRYEKCGEAG